MPTRRQRVWLRRISMVAPLWALGAPATEGLAQAQLEVSIVEKQHLLGEDNLYGEAYGRHVAIDGETMVTAGVDQVVVWQHYFDGWGARRHLRPSLTHISSIAVDDDLLVVGGALTPYNLGGPIDGTVSVFRRQGEALESPWIEILVFEQPDSALLGYEIHSFGSAVAVEGELIMVGAPDSRVCCAGDVDGPGFVFMYDAGDPSRQAYLTDDTPDRYFGASVDFESGFLAVGAPREFFGPGKLRGAGYICLQGEGLFDWSFEYPPIFWPDPNDDTNFGSHVSVDLNRMAFAGSGGVKIVRQDGTQGRLETFVPLPGRTVRRLDDALAIDERRVLYVDAAHDQVVSIERTEEQWAVEGTLSAVVNSTPAAVAVTGPRAAVGYPFEDVAGPDTGLIVPYWTFTGEAAAPLSYGDANLLDRFGSSLSAAQTGPGRATAIVGAPADRTGFLTLGAAYFFAYEATTDTWTKMRRWVSDCPGGSPREFGKAAIYNGFSDYAVNDDNVVHVVHPATGLRCVDYVPPAPRRFYRNTPLAYQADRLLVGVPDSFDSAGAFLGFFLDGPTWTPTGIFVPPGPAESGAEFGAAIAMEGEWAAVGAPDERPGGAVYVFRDPNLQSQWQHAERLDPGGLDPSAGFGYTVVLQGDWLFVAAPRQDTVSVEAGAVFVFARQGNTWSHADTLAPPNNIPYPPHAWFGTAILVDDRDLLIGAPGPENPEFNPAITRVHPFRLLTGRWTPAPTDPLNRFICCNPDEQAGFGKTLAKVHDQVLVGAPMSDEAVEDAGMVVVYDYNARITVPAPQDENGQPCGYPFEVTFEELIESPTNPAVSARFGDAFDVSDDTMVVGETQAVVNWVDDQGKAHSLPRGMVHIYRRLDLDEWALEQTLEPPREDLVPTTTVNFFGQTVALDGDWLAVGQSNGRWVYVYHRTLANWELKARLLSPNWDAVLRNGFGINGLDISGTTIMVGDTRFTDQTLPAAAGAVSFFDLQSDGTWAQTAGPLASSEAHAGQHFGHRVALDAQVGRAVATGDLATGGSRSAYLLERIGGVWQETTVLNADPFGATARFGKWGLDLAGDTVAVGDIHFVFGGLITGGTFVWQHDGVTWVGPDVINGSGTAGNDQQGHDVSLQGDLMVIGSPSGPHVPGIPNSPRTGVTHVFAPQAGVWMERIRLAPADPAQLFSFGHVTALFGGLVLTGSPFGPNNQNGGLFAYDLACLLPDADGDGVTDSRDLCPNSIPGATVDADGCPPEIPGDYNRDGDVDQDDVNLFNGCVSGPTVPYIPGSGCEDMDFDEDGDVDQDDFAVLQRCLSGTNNPGDPTCAN